MCNNKFKKEESTITYMKGMLVGYILGIVIGGLILVAVNTIFSISCQG